MKKYVPLLPLLSIVFSGAALAEPKLDITVEVGGAGTLPRSVSATRVAGTVSLIGVLTAFFLVFVAVSWVFTARSRDGN